MATNSFFRNTDYTPEQTLIQDLTTEMIQIHGEDFYYLPRKHEALDPLLNEDALSYFDDALEIEMYVKNWGGFGGFGDLLSKFGSSQNDQLELSVSRPRFSAEIGDKYNIPRPFEGDLVYFPINGYMFEITFVEHESTFYQRGSLQFWDLTLEKFSYSDERFTTGIPGIDKIQTNYSEVAETYELLFEDNNIISTETNIALIQEEYSIMKIDLYQGQNEIFQTEALDFVDFTETDPFGTAGIKY